MRLALLADDAEDAAWRAVQLRLRRAALAKVTLADLAGRAADFDAVVVAAAVDVEHVVRAGKPILLLRAHAAGALPTSIVPITLGRPLRFRPDVAAVKAALASGRLGAPALVRLHHWSARGAATLAAALDLIHWLVEVLPTQVFAVAHRSAAAYVQVHLGFPDGGMALLDLAPLADGPDYFSLSVIGRTGAASADDHHNTHLRFGGAAPAALFADISTSGTLAALLDDFAGALRTPPDDAFRTVQQLQGAVNASLTARQPVAWTGGRYEPVA